MYSLAEYECTCPKVKLAVNREKKKGFGIPIFFSHKKRRRKKSYDTKLKRRRKKSPRTYTKFSFH